MPQFIVDRSDLDPAAARATLRGAEARHCAAVVRLTAGDPVQLADGAGSRWQGVCGAATPSRVEITGLRPLPGNEAPLELELLQGLPKGERWEDVLEKGTELGVASFQPLYTTRSVPHIPAARLGKRLQRWQEKVRAALKQCERGRLPRIREPQGLAGFLGSLGVAAPDELRLVLAEREDGASWPPAARRVRLAVGPEGGWTGEEREALRGAGFVPLSLGPRILRTDTAAVVGAALVMQRWGDLVSPATR